MGQYEVTWEEYETWLYSLDILRRKPLGYKSNDADKLADLISRPTKPYLDMSFGMGKKQRPAICMTQLAAKTYCMWLSAKTGHFYRLPTEAEWEFSCRAGTTGKYYFEDESRLEDYVWHFENSDDLYQEIGSKKPNPWGLYNMLGNVSEWCLDSFSEDYYSNSPKENPLNLPKLGSQLNSSMEAEWPSKIYSRVARGGSFADDASDISVFQRKVSAPNWKDQDPQIPKSVWYLTDATWLGFRLVRMKNLPKIEEVYKYWPTDDEISSIPKR